MVYLSEKDGKLKKWLRENYTEGYEILTHKIKLEKYVKNVIEIIRNSKIYVKGICVHYPKLVVVM